MLDVVWLKKDVRLADHGPLATVLLSDAPPAADKFAVLYLYEPSLLRHPTAHGSHVAFANEGLAELELELQKLRCGDNAMTAEEQPTLTTFVAEAVEALRTLHESRHGPIARLLSHEETGHMASYARDKAVKQFCCENSIEWKEWQQSGVVRGLRSRADIDDTPFAARWSQFMSAPQHPDPRECPVLRGKARRRLRSALVVGESVGLVHPADQRLAMVHPSDRPARQRGGERLALQMLQSFLECRGRGYSDGISSPSAAWTSCSRLSTFLTYGHVSIRTVYRRLTARQLRAREDKNLGEPGKVWLRPLAAFAGRLRWRSHFVQKFEMEVEMEQQCQCAAYEGLRTQPGDHNSELARAFESGLTGFPMVDACMRCLLATGWLNFRMRAMLASFAAYNLWLDWRHYGKHLARAFLDYEPGIHYPQLQMQAGVTGINALRVYNVIKQGRDNDPTGVFIRKYLPELSGVPLKHLHEPSKMTTSEQAAAGVVIARARPGGSSAMRWYPLPIVDADATARLAKERISAITRKPDTQAAARQVFLKHGSRRGGGASEEVIASRRKTKQPRACTCGHVEYVVHGCTCGGARGRGRGRGKGRGANGTALGRGGGRQTVLRFREIPARPPQHPHHPQRDHHQQQPTMTATTMSTTNIHKAGLKRGAAAADLGGEKRAVGGDVDGDNIETKRARSIASCKSAATSRTSTKGTQRAVASASNVNWGVLYDINAASAHESGASQLPSRHCDGITPTSSLSLYHPAAVDATGLHLTGRSDGRGSITRRDCRAEEAWSCAACTFRNHAALRECEICERPRRG